MDAAFTGYGFEEVEETAEVMRERSVEHVFSYDIHGQQLLTFQQRILEQINPIAYLLP